MSKKVFSFIEDFRLIISILQFFILFKMIFILITLFAIFCYQNAVSETTEKTIPFNLLTVKNEIVSIDTLLQKSPVLIIFWALWCKPCKEELQAVKNSFNVYPFNEIKIVIINQDTPRSISKVSNYVKIHKLPFITCLDPDQKLLHLFNAWGIPFSVFLNKKREIVFKKMGYIPGDEKDLQKKIESYLKIYK